MVQTWWGGATSKYSQEKGKNTEKANLKLLKLGTSIIYDYAEYTHSLV